MKFFIHENKLIVSNISKHTFFLVICGSFVVITMKKFSEEKKINKTTTNCLR